MGSNTYGGISRSLTNGTSDTADLYYSHTTRTFSPEKTYIIKTEVDNFDSTVSGGRLVVENVWGQTFSYESSTLPLSSDSGPSVTLSWVFKNNTSVSTNFYVKYYNDDASQFPQNPSYASVIKSFQLVELDWEIKGWSFATSSYYITNYQGWQYTPGTDKFLFTRHSPNASAKKTGDGRQDTNYISKYVPYDYFNLFFTYGEFGSSSGNSYLDVFLIDSTSVISVDSVTVSSFTASLYGGQYLGRVNEVKDYEFYNLTGNRYLVFVANWTSTAFTYGTYIENLQITGGYHETINNEKFLFTNTNQYLSPTTLDVIGAPNDATYSSIATTNTTLHFTNSLYYGATGNPGYFSNLYGDIVNLSAQYSKVGNGNFVAGIWENGVWNNGWRVDEQVYEFNEVVAAFTTTTKNYKWRVQISGPTQSVENFNVGDKVSIGNIVSININEERKLIKNYFTVILKDENNIVFEIENNFPIRRIVKDSDNHKIRITKNVWLNGAFLNGYFEGIWNNGLLKGLPKITEMYNTNWIDGTFDGGYFNSSYTFYTSQDTEFRDGLVGLSFSATTPHTLSIGDLIIIDKTDKSVNPQYDGTASITSIIDDFHVVTDIPWGNNTTAESAIVRKFAASSLIQNVNFYDNNVAPKNAKQSQVLKDIWRFNSHLDLNFSTQSATTINRNRIFENADPLNPIDAIFNLKFGVGEFSAPNLYGPTTEDVLSSKSKFRDIDSFDENEYSLGTKYEIFTDFLDEISEFNSPFTTATSSKSNMANFFADGWTYSFAGTYSMSSGGIPTGFTMSRTNNGTFKLEFPNNSLTVISLDNTNISIDKKRYSLIEFDVVDYGTKNPSYEIYLNSYLNLSLFNFPKFVDESGDYTSTNAFPVSDNIFHIYNGLSPKKSFFYNKSGLDISFLGLPGFYFELDNIKFYEVDAIPFFQYTTDDYVNSQVQVPYQAIAPFIDYDNANFSFVDNITFGFDSIQLNTSNTPIATGSVGIAYTQ